jgi:hypothetical protein
MTTLPTFDRAFLDVMCTHRGGTIITDVSKAMRQLAAAVQNTGKSGKVVLTLNLRPAGHGDASLMIFEPDVTSKIPAKTPPGSVFYTDDDFNLVRDDPRQQPLALKVVDEAAPAGPLKEVS